MPSFNMNSMLRKHIPISILALLLFLVANYGVFANASVFSTNINKIKKEINNDNIKKATKLLKRLNFLLVKM